MNNLVDVIIIGDSKAGHNVMKKLAAERPFLKMAFISREFKSFTTLEKLNIEYIRQEVAHINYKNRLFYCYFITGEYICGTHLILATGVSYEPLKAGNKILNCVANNADDIIKQAKNLPAVVIGEDAEAVKLALAVAKKYKQVYLCLKQITFNGVNTSLLRKLNQATNIAVLPNTKIVKVTAIDELLYSVELSNYSTVTSHTIFVKTKSKPETAFVPDNIIKKDDFGYCLTNTQGESTVVPKCFAIGHCAKKHGSVKERQVIECILKDFN